MAYSVKLKTDLCLNAIDQIDFMRFCRKIDLLKYSQIRSMRIEVIEAPKWGTTYGWFL